MKTLSDFQGTHWTGTAELWLDPLGDDAVRSECTISVGSDKVSYTWSHEGTAHEGSLTLTDDGAAFADTFHQPQPMPCVRLAGVGGLFQVLGEYGPKSEWGWRTSVSVREPAGELVLQMTNIAPWGEEVRAVRMICSRKP